VVRDSSVLDNAVNALPKAEQSNTMCSKEKAQADKEKKASRSGVACLIDPGSNAHLTNVRGVLEPGSTVACYAEVQGLSGKGQALVSRKKGKFVYEVGNDVSIVLDDVLYVPDAVLSSTMNEPMVLISSGKMARKHNIGTHFVAGGMMLNTFATDVLWVDSILLPVLMVCM